MHMRSRPSIIALALVALGATTQSSPFDADPRERQVLYVAVPGVRNYTEHGGVGVLVFDMDHGHRFVKRIPTIDTPSGQEAEAVKGVAASAKTGRLYVTTTKRIVAIDINTDH